MQPAPRSFIDTRLNQLSRQQMIQAVTYGSQGSAMQGFSHLLDTAEIAAVVDFVRDQFMRRQAKNTRYHTVENGWEGHDEKYAAAYPFALGEIALDTPFESLTENQKLGWQLFMQGCVSCHDRAQVLQEGDIWQKRPVSFPRNQYSHLQPDAVSSASIYAEHDKGPSLGKLTAQEQRGQEFFKANCAFCHGLDGSGQNWIGSYVEPHPRDLRNLKRDQWPLSRIERAIAKGVTGSAMPAWQHVLQEEEISAVARYVQRLAQHYQDESAQGNR